MNKSIIQIAGKFYKKCQVVMLPTQKAEVGGLVIRDIDKKLVLHTNVINWHGENQHLYFISDDEIKEGDWIYHGNTGISKATKITSTNIASKKGLHIIQSCKKVIATTNFELTLEEAKHGEWCYLPKDNSIKFQRGKYVGALKILPRPSNIFLKKYSEKGGIHEVFIELTWTNKRISIGHTIREDYRPKVAKDNTISIKPLKDNWNKDERFYIIYINESKFFFR